MRFTLQDREHLDTAARWLQEGEWERGREELEVISLCCRGHPEVLRWRVELYALAGNPEAALVLGEALAEWPDADAGMYVTLARCCVQMNRLTYARDWLSQAIGRDSTDAFRSQLERDPVLSPLCTRRECLAS